MKNIAVLLILVLFSGVAYSVEPEGTSVGRLEAVVANLKNKAVDKGVPQDLDLLLRVADAFQTEWPEEFASLVVDAENPTANERAGFVLLKLKEYAQGVLRRQAQIAKRAELVDEPVQSAADAAAADLE